MNNKVCSIIVTYNIGNDFYNCFNSIINQVDKVIIVDNGSNQETKEVLKKIQLNDKVEIIYNVTNLGIAVALNQGVYYAIEKKYDWVLTMDNDSEATPNMVKSMLGWYKNYEEKDNIVSLFPEYIEKSTLKDKSKCISFFKVDDFEEVFFDNTSGNLVKTIVFQNIGKFREDFFIDSVDHDFCLRIKQAGWKMVKLKNIKLLHSLGNTKQIKCFGKIINSSNHSALRRYYITRNRCIMRKLYSNELQYIKYDKKTFINENLKILLFEKDKINKFKMSYKGYKDYRRNILGKIDEKRR